MAAPSAVAGAVVLIHFPFSDLSRTKLRPAAVLADVGRGDFILCQITSNPYADPLAIEVHDKDFAAGGLEHVSYIRPAKLFTANERLIVKIVGRLSFETHGRVVYQIKTLLEVQLERDQP